jgi:hypothetical protein
MRSFVVFALAVVCVFAADSEFSFEGNFTSKNLEQFKFRASGVAVVASPIQQLPISGLGWTSAAVEGSILNHSAGVTADVISALHIPGGDLAVIKFPPMTFGTYISGQAKFDPIYFFKAITGQTTAEASAGLIGFMIPGVMEVDSEGKIVGGISFAQAWNVLSKVDGTAEGVEIYKSSIVSTEKATVTEYVAASQVAGYLKYGKTPVSPNSLEVMLEINDYKYQDPKNHLELVFASAVVTAEGKGKVEAEIAYNEIAEGFSTYVAVNSKATVDGKSASVKASVVADADLQDAYKILDDIRSKITAAFAIRGNVDISYRKIPFPAGAKNIIFDPAIGAGKNVYNSASSVVLSVLAVLLAVFLLF